MKWRGKVAMKRQRMTKLVGTRYFAKKGYTYDLLEDKLGRLEDVDEKLGVKLYQLITNGYFYKYDLLTNVIAKEDLKDWFIDIKNKRLIQIYYFVKNFRNDADIIRNTFEEIKFSDYGKKGLSTDWALTKEELL